MANGVNYRRLFGSPLLVENWINEELASWALLNIYPIKTKKMCDIVFIQTNKGFRKKGHGTQLIEKIQMDFDKIGTSYKHSSTAGKKLLEKCNFKRIKESLVWEK